MLNRKPRHRPVTPAEEARLQQSEAILRRLLGLIQARRGATRAPIIQAAVEPLLIPLLSISDRAALRLLAARRRGKPVPHLLRWLDGSGESVPVAVPMVPMVHETTTPRDAASRSAGRPRLPLTPADIGAELAREPTVSDTVLAQRFSARLNRPISRIVVRDRRLEWERTRPRKKTRPPKK
jgi:hypothetical protein